MTFTIDNVYPWGRTLDEYRRMFDLSPSDLASSIVSLADGPASFNAELSARGGRVLSCDPLYQFDPDVIRARVEATRGVMLDLVRKNAHRFVWDRIRSPEALGELRTGAMKRFLDDYESGRQERRYIDKALPTTGLASDRFDLAICSHFLFLYSDDFPLSFHLQAIEEMIRLAPDVRVFPLLDMLGEPCAYVEPVMSALRAKGLTVERRKVDYEFQLGGNQMLRVTR